jgi:hypothetical protein
VNANSILLSLLLLSTTAGCKLLPGRVEYFQKEVKSIPELGQSAVQRQKQGAAYVADKTRATREAAIAAEAPASVLVPAAEAAVVADGLAVSLGPPTSPYSGSGTNLAARLEKDRAQVDQQIDKQREKQEPLVGKKIEGTGLVNMSYFTQIGILLGLAFLVWAGLKAYGLFNPLVGTGLAVAERVSGKVAAKAVATTFTGIEHFKELLQEGAAYSKDQIKELLSTALQKRQDQDVQKLARRLTHK